MANMMKCSRLDSVRRHGFGNRKRRSGSTVVLVALSFTVLCGCAALTVDYGLLVWTRNKLQRACDAAALAGASQLPAAIPAMEVAGKVAAQNGAPNPSYGWPYGLRKIKVSASEEVKFGLARILGFDSRVVTASAVAARIPLKGVPGSVPLAITTNDYYAYRPQVTETAPYFVGGNSFELLLVRNHSEDFNPGNITALDLRLDNSSKSVDTFREDLTYGYGRTLYPDEMINALNASQSTQTAAIGGAITKRIEDAKNAPYGDVGNNYSYPDYPTMSRRIVTLIVAPPNPANNNDPRIKAQFIVPVYIVKFRETGNGDRSKFYVTIRILPSKFYSSDDNGVVLGDENSPDTGLASVQLVD